MRIFDSKPALRWFAPLAFVLVLAGGGLVAATATADNKLPTRTAEQLLVDLQGARTDGLSGTVVQRADLGIPAIPGAGGADSSELTSLLSGTHTMRVAYSAPDKMRLSVHGAYSQTDVIRNGTDLWTWSSKDRTATHRTMPDYDEADGKAERPQNPGDVPATPQEAADRLLEALDADTAVTTDSAVTVAGRAAYELVLTPDADGTMISQVRMAIDGDTKLPLRVQVYGTGDRLAFEVGYTSVSFTRPDAAEFAFNPPPGTTVTEGGEVHGKATDGKAPTEEQRKEAEKKAEDARGTTKVVGSGWTTVVVAQAQDVTGANADPQVDSFLNALQRVEGSWGKGRLMAGTAFSAVLTDDGRVAMGMVTPELLYQALSR